MHDEIKGEWIWRESMRKGVSRENHMGSGSVGWASTGVRKLEVAGLNIMRGSARTGGDWDNFALVAP